MLGVLNPKPSRYLLYRAPGALVPYIVGTWGVRESGSYGMRLTAPGLLQNSVKEIGSGSIMR